MPDRIAYFNGRFLAESQTAISPMDRGFLYGDGVFDTLRAVKGRIVSFHEHFMRLKEACQQIRIPLEIAPTDLREIFGELLRKNDLNDATIRITISRGEGDQLGYGYSKSQKPTTLVIARPARSIPEALYEKGVSAEFMMSPQFGQKQSQIKSLSALSLVLAKQNALDKEAYEMIMTDAFDTVYEGTSSNIFIVKSRVLWTPPVSLGVMPGITRSRVIVLAGSTLKIPVEERSISKKDLLSADEVFLTNTNVEILPVTKLAGQILSGGKMGDVTRHIRDAFRQTLIEILE